MKSNQRVYFGRKVLGRLTGMRSWSFIAVLSSPFTFACQVAIGDDCGTSVECSPNGDRLCDTAQPGGYCTVFNCEPGGCPDDSVCIAYRTSPSSLDACVDPAERPRLQRTFCLASCRRDGDCRAGYACVDLGETNPWAATVAEADGVSGRVCVVPYVGPQLPDDRSTEVCTSFAPPEPPPPLVESPSAQAVDGGIDAGN